jgi:hypothetical protein
MVARIFMALVLLFSIALWAGYYYLGSAAKAGIEFAGEAAFKTEVRVDSVTLSPLNGKSSIRGLSIANPAGYSEGPAIALGAIEATVNLGSLFDDTIEIDLLRLAQPQINYETKITRDNLRALLANLPSRDAGSASGDGPAADSTKRVLLRRVEILGPQLTVSAAVGSTQVILPDIILTDIGGEDGGASIAAAAEVVIRELLSSIGAANLPSLDQVRQGVEDRAREEAEKIEDQITKTVEEALGTSLDDLGNRLRNLRN